MFLLPSFLELNALGDYLCESICILAYVFEADAKVFENIKVIAGTEETSGFAIEKHSADIGIVSESLSEGCFPFVTVTVSLESDRCGCRLSDRLSISVECRLTVIRMLTVQQVKRKAERKSSVIVIDDIKRSIFSVKLFDSSFVFHRKISFLICKDLRF